MCFHVCRSFQGHYLLVYPSSRWIFYENMQIRLNFAYNFFKWLSLLFSSRSLQHQSISSACTVGKYESFKNVCFDGCTNCIKIMTSGYIIFFLQLIMPDVIIWVKLPTEYQQNVFKLRFSSSYIEGLYVVPKGTFCDTLPSSLQLNHILIIQ